MGCEHYKLQGLQTEIGKKLQNGLWAVYRSLTLGPVAGYHVSLGFFFFSFLFSRDLRATSRLVLRRTGNVRFPLDVIRSDGLSK